MASWMAISDDAQAASTVYVGPMRSRRLAIRPTLMFGSNNYLGLTLHPDVVAAAQQAVARYGTGTNARSSYGAAVLSAPTASYGVTSARQRWNCGADGLRKTA